MREEKEKKIQKGHNIKSISAVILLQDVARKKKEELKRGDKSIDKVKYRKS